MKKTWKRLCTGFLAFATVVTALPTIPVHAESKQYWTESAERVGIIEKVMNDGSIGSTFNEGYMKVEGETAYCIDINTDFKNGYKTRADASSRMSADQISDVALSLEYVKQYGEAHKELNLSLIHICESPAGFSGVFCDVLEFRKDYCRSSGRADPGGRFVKRDAAAAERRAPEALHAVDGDAEEPRLRVLLAFQLRLFAQDRKSTRLNSSHRL